MGRRAATATSTKKHTRVPMTPEDREQYLINLSLDAAEKQLREGTASSQVITHFLKLGSSRELLEQEKIKEETKQARAKIDSLEASNRSEERYAAAIEAMRRYQGIDDE
nr:MAG TPA: hypothetical protein [Caudoviricetes sp.]